MTIDPPAPRSVSDGTMADPCGDPFDELDLPDLPDLPDMPDVGDEPAPGSGMVRRLHSVGAGDRRNDTTDDSFDPIDDSDAFDAFGNASDSRVGQAPDDDGFDDLDDEGSSFALFEGDTGVLDLAQRQALVTLIKKRFVTAAADAKVWKTIAANPDVLRSRLHDLFMDLYIDTEREIAFKRQVSSETGAKFTTLLYDKPWGREESILLVHLRGRLRNEQAAGSARVFVDRDDLLEAVERLRPLTATDRAADRKRVLRAVDALYEAGLLIGRKTGPEYQVSPAIEVILPVEKLRELLEWLKDASAETPHAVRLSDPLEDDQLDDSRDLDDDLDEQDDDLDEQDDEPDDQTPDLSDTLWKDLS